MQKLHTLPKPNKTKGLCYHYLRKKKESTAHLPDTSVDKNLVSQSTAGSLGICPFEASSQFLEVRNSSTGC